MKYRQKINGQWSNWINFNIKALDGMPIGSIIMFAGETIPTGWLICDGDTLNEEEYPELYDVIGYTYGGSGLDFNLPDFRGRAGFGHDDMTTGFYPMGNTGGEKTHTLTTNEMPTHNHAPSISIDGNDVYWGGSGNKLNLQSTGIQWTSGTNGSTISTSSTGGNQPHNNMPPYIVVNYIIKATNTTPTMASVVNTTNNSTEDTYSCNYINNLQPIELYSSSGSSVEITLNDTTANYSYIEIFGNTNGNWTSIKLDAPNGKIFEPSMRYIAGTQMVFILATYNINGTKITPDTTKCGYATINNNGVANFNYDQTNYFYITKVIGYK